MAKKRQPRAKLSVMIPELHKKALEEIAERNDVSLARVVQEVVTEFLRKHKKNQPEILRDLKRED
jgi:hypothetical protein